MSDDGPREHLAGFFASLPGLAEELGAHVAFVVLRAPDGAVHLAGTGGWDLEELKGDLEQARADMDLFVEGSARD